MSDRIGANRAYVRIPFTKVKLVWWGLFHGIADGVQDAAQGELHAAHLRPRSPTPSRPGSCSRRCCWCSPSCPSAARSTRASCLGIPSLAGWFGDRTYPMQIAGLDAGLLFVFAFGGLTIIGTMLAGWSSNNKFSLLGALARRLADDLLRARRWASRVLGLILIYGTLDLDAIVQRQSGMLLGVAAGLGHRSTSRSRAVLFLTAAIAENKRIPFDLPEAESELIAGYFTEYTSMKMGLFMFAEFIEIAIIGALVHDALPRRLQPAVHDRRRLRASPAAPPVALRHGAVVVLQLVDVPRQGASRRAASRSWSAGRCRASATTSCWRSRGSSCSRWRSPTSS